MITLDVSFGIFAFLPQGWIFMAFVIFCECYLISKLLTAKWVNKRIYWVVAGSNITSGLVGIVTSMLLNGGWYLVVWFPWVSSHEINIHNKESLRALVIFYLVAFVVSIAIETIFNLLFLKKVYMVKRIIWATVIANIVTYLVGTLVLYSYSLGLL
ncbi:MAG TPA: hypothetical protein PLA24_01980 [Tenuifilaceae bacterium]|nr:hypothetical protein [Tenuifilaceae bacterium]